MDSSKAPSGKRRRTSVDSSTSLSLVGLSNDHLTAIADYLPKTSRALLAVALTASPESWRATGWKGQPSDTSKAIISSAEAKSWEGLDFYDSNIRERAKLTRKLNDDDLAALLVCIDAKNKLKKLFLDYYCQGIVGHGLEPLVGSVVLEEIGVSSRLGVGRTHNLSPATFIPVLDNIISSAGNSLREIGFPREWVTGKRRNESPLREFLQKFNKLLINDENQCEVCGELCGGDNENDAQACFICFKIICPRIVHQARLRRCDHCRMDLCDGCGQYKLCGSCDKVHCSVCAERDDVDAAVSCEECVEEGYPPVCLGCRLPDDEETCEKCRSLLYPALLVSHKRMADEIKQLRQENEYLRKQIAPPPERA